MNPFPRPSLSCYFLVASVSKGNTLPKYANTRQCSMAQLRAGISQSCADAIHDQYCLRAWHVFYFRSCSIVYESAENIQSDYQDKIAWHCGKCDVGSYGMIQSQTRRLQNGGCYQPWPTHRDVGLCYYCTTIPPLINHIIKHSLYLFSGVRKVNDIFVVTVRLGRILTLD